MPRTPEEMRELERSLAHDHAVSTIDGLCLHVEPVAEDDFYNWFDTEDENLEEYEASLIAEAIEYLEWRGLLLRAKASHRFIAVKDEHEAPANAEGAGD